MILARPATPYKVATRTRGARYQAGELRLSIQSSHGCEGNRSCASETRRRTRPFHSRQGLGSYDTSTRIETPRITVTLATSISEERCHRINLGYLDPASVKLEESARKENAGIAVIQRAGEKLYRVRNHSAQMKKPLGTSEATTFQS